MLSSDFLERWSGVLRTLNLETRVHPRRCLRTGPDGRIPLTSDWQALFDGLRGFGPVVLQTRHAYARLISVAPLPDIRLGRNELCACDEKGRLHLRLDSSLSVWGRTETCPCCGSPGRVELHNAHGADFLQICALPDCAVESWHSFIGQVAAVDDAPACAAASSGFGSFPSLPLDAVWLTTDAGQLEPLLLALGDSDAPVTCGLHTAELGHVRELKPRRVEIHDGVLTAGSRANKLQVGLPAVRGLVASGQAGSWRLHLAGPGETELLTLEAAADPAAADIWQTALEGVFPALSR